MLRGGRKIRLIIGAGLVLFAVLKYCSSAEINPYTNEKQHIGLSETEEIAMGLNAAPQMAHQAWWASSRHAISRRSGSCWKKISKQ